MKFNNLIFCSFSGIALLWLSAFNVAVAEIVPDTTLPVNSTVTPQDNIRRIEGGTQRGDNLFHSFQEFSFSVLTGDVTGDTAFFNNDLAVRNIITRVTGGLPSNIDGIIGATGTANLFFINPNGIVFGPNASLDIKGSFVASTANSLKFADGTEFSASASETSPILTVSIPLGLQFGVNSGDIVNRSQASPNQAVNSIGLPVGLQVQSGETLALVGNNISLPSGNITVTGGRIELGSVGEGSFVNLNEIETGYALEYTNVQNFRDILLSGGANIDASESGGEAVQLQGRNITLSEGSLVFSITSGSQLGGNLIINATESVKLSEGSNIATFVDGESRSGNVLIRALNSIELLGTASDGTPSAVGSQVCLFSVDCSSVTGNGGNLLLETGRLLIQDGGQATTTTFGAGRAGNLNVTSNSIALVGTTLDSQQPSGLFAAVEEGATGDGGNLSIATGRLIVLDGAQISTAARTGGDGGNLTINALEFIQLSGTSLIADEFIGDIESEFDGSSGIFVSAQPDSTGDAGDLIITTGQLSVEEGAIISADAFALGQGGNVTLNVTQLTVRDGGQVRAGSFNKGSGGTLTINASESIEVSGTGTIGIYPVTSTLFTQSESSGDAGDLNIHTRTLSVRDGGNVTVSSIGTGTAGELTISARSVELDTNAFLTATTNSGNGGNIELQADDLLLLRRNSNISTRAGTPETSGGTGGIITINTDNLVALENSDIDANAFGGAGGQVRISAQGVFGTQVREQQTPESDITASSDLGPQFSGTVEIITPDVDPSQGLVTLPIETVDASNQVATGCTNNPNANQGRFVISGRGGLPLNPGDALGGDAVLTNWATLGETEGENISRRATTTSIAENLPTQQIVEAQGWIVDANGKVFLTAQAPTVTPNTNKLNTTSCNGS